MDRTKRSKVVSAEEAVGLIRDRDTVATAKYVGIGFAEELAIKLEDEFLGDRNPRRDLTLLIYAAGQGDGEDRGLNHLAHEGLVRQ